LEASAFYPPELVDVARFVAGERSTAVRRCVAWALRVFSTFCLLGDARLTAYARAVLEEQARSNAHIFLP
jgi:hypothetical protein